MKKQVLAVLAMMAMGLGLAQTQLVQVAEPGIPIPSARPVAREACKGLLERVAKLVGKVELEKVNCFAFSSKSGSVSNQFGNVWSFGLALTPLRLVSLIDQDGVLVASFVNTLAPSGGVYMVAGETDSGLAHVAIWSAGGR
jgi:hypothetical protein